MADTQKRGVSSQYAGQQQSYAERRPEASASSAGKKKRSKRNEYMLNQYVYETRQEQLPINEMFVQKYR
ncbi:hypothetical protein H634G_10314 [Metarhizium anisopliae BRIP 53293]|uniref:Uncharacterized protein n=1 Tax=Metarhizium anisopliae BRIP 53293 TaxID=1291518 RepID=A0A0D9NK08_METAN|nr:hypothetical protein H634G_10314 [Metarhizium anisopliae BRIP 53293]KJK87744.1 hypothetical protein H633G_08407 [Metarhizium anisopliae BRIP 53284]